MKKISKHIEITILPHTTVDDMTHLRLTGTTVGAKVLCTEYTPYKSKKELFLADSKYKQNAMNILSKKLVESAVNNPWQRY